MTYFGFAIAAAVLASLTITLVVVGNELGLARARIAGFGLSMSDGPLLGYPLGAQARRRLSAASPSNDVSSALLVFLTSTCEPCHSLIHNLARIKPHELAALNAILIVAGPPGPVQPVLRSVEERRVVCITGADADAIHAACAIRYTPSVVRLDRGIAQTKGVVSGVATLHEARTWDAHVDTSNTPATETLVESTRTTR